ncbi:MAG: hydantoinase/oxoprolinase family protein, partial [Planctomycetota bacterium]|nr:hydantoinase/oxoprolinase family protein [Planctomycetota bacterium]
MGGELKLNAPKARAVFEERIAKPSSLSVAHAAYGAHQIVASNMIRAIKAVSTERGRDPRGYALFAFGGSGPIFGAGMARELGIKRIVVPPLPGLFSSFGLLYADVEHHYSRTLRRLLRKADLEELNLVWDKMVADALEQLAADGFPESKRRVRRTASMHYQGQTFELTVPVPDGPIDEDTVAALEEA